MSFWFLCNFVQSRAHQNEAVQIAMEKLNIEIERNQTMQQEQLVTLENKIQLQMELQMIRIVAEQLEDERQQHDYIASALNAAYQSAIELCGQLKRIDLKKLAGYEIFVNDMQRQEEHKEMENIFRQRQDMFRKMENRHIVQQLRSKQTELKAATTELQEVENYSQSTLAKATKKLEATQQQRIDMILNLVKGAKQLGSLREEIKNISSQKQELQDLQTKKIELDEQLHKLQELPLSQLPSSDPKTLSIEKSPTFKRPKNLEIKPNIRPKDFNTPSTIDLYNPMDFIKSLDVKFDISKAMQQFYQDLEAEKQKPATVSSEPIQILRSILRPSNQDKESQLATKTGVHETRHVRFVEPNENWSTTSSSPAPSMEFNENISSDENKIPLNISDNENNDEQLDQNVSEAVNEAESIVCLTLSSEISPAQTTRTHLIAEGAEKKSEAVVEILENKIIKPAGTAIPKTLPVSITPSPTKGHELPVTETVEPIATPPIEAITTAEKVFKSPINVLNDMVDAKTSIKNALDAFLKQPKEPNPTSDSKQSTKSEIRGKQSQLMDFDSYFLSNVSPESEEEESALPPASHTNNAALFLDFGGSTDQLESDEALNFSDNDFQTGARTLHDFF